MIFLTGATGFLGGAVVNRLLEAPIPAATRRGRPTFMTPTIVALCRTPSRRLSDRGIGVEVGPLADRAWLEGLLSPGDVVVHMAGKVEFTASGIREMHEVHVEGTRSVANAALARGARLVLISSSGTTAISRHDRPVDETAGYPMELVAKWPYYLTKTLQERLVLDMVAQDGLEAVVLNPSLLLGPGDDRVGSTAVVKDYLDRRLKVVPGGGISVVDVRDAAAAVVAAIVGGRKSERYFLAGHNCRFSTFFRVLEATSQVRAPRLQLPGALAVIAAKLAKRLDIGDFPHPSLLEMAQYYWYADSRKAARELGFSPRPLEGTVRDTISYLRTLS